MKNLQKKNSLSNETQENAAPRDFHNPLSCQPAYEVLINSETTTNKRTSPRFRFNTNSKRWCRPRRRWNLLSDEDDEDLTMMNSSGCKLLHRWRQHSHSVPAPTTENPAINHAPQLHATHKSACNKLIHSTDERSGGMKESAMYANRYTIGNHSRDDGVECGLELEAVSIVQSMSIMLLDGFSLTAPAAILIWQRNSRNSSKNDRHNNNKFTFQFDIFLHKSRFFSREGLRLSSVTKPIRDPTRIYNFCRQLD